MRAVIAIAAALALAGPAAAATPSRTEQPVKSIASDAKIVKESYVRLYDPLPADSAPHPADCDWLSYMRWRDAKGPARSTKAHAVVVLMPGFLAGGSSFDELARNTIRTAAARKRHIEVWGIDRRANCLEDRHGVSAAVHARSIQPAFDYYYGGKTVEGRKFPGFVSTQDAKFLEGFGLERTVRDWYTVLTREMPGQKRRAKRVICGGHSLGGPLTAAFASWDFDGDPKTTRDAGYNQCAGLLGLDTTVAVDGSSGGPTGAGTATDVLARSGSSPYINAPPLTPGTIQLTSIASVGAYYTPDQESNFNKLIPNTPEYEITLRALYSRNAAHFASGVPSARDYRVTHATLFGSIFDDNSAGIFFLRSSIGFASGGPFVDKNFPAPDPTLALTSSTDTLYHWQDYRQVGANGASIPLNEEGQPYTTRDGEVSDINDLARTMFEAPANFVEQYFPTRILTDVVAAEGGDRSGSLANLRYAGPGMKPLLYIQAGDSMNNADAPDSGPAHTTATRPNDKPLSREIVIPGYNHLDVVTAARKQTDGHVEASSAKLAAFTMKAVPGRR
jgi:pimeloyl-ACP methyl ester carboxylesterase